MRRIKLELDINCTEEYCYRCQFLTITYIKVVNMCNIFKNGLSNILKIDPKNECIKRCPQCLGCDIGNETNMS